MSANGEAKLGQGNVEVTLGVHSFTMKPTIHAMGMLSMKYGGLQDVMEKIARTDVNCTADVLAAGIGGNRFNGPKGRQELLQLMYDSGLTDDTGGVCAQAQLFVLMLMRGGRPLPNMGEIEDPTQVAPKNA